MVTRLLRWERCFGAERGLRERRGAAEAVLAGSSANFLSRPRRRLVAEHRGSPRQGCVGPAVGTRQTWSLSPRGWHGSHWSVFILFLCSIIFLTQQPPGMERRQPRGDWSQLQQKRKNLEGFLQGECVSSGTFPARAGGAELGLL